MSSSSPIRAIVPAKHKTEDVHGEHNGEEEHCLSIESAQQERQIRQRCQNAHPETEELDGPDDERADIDTAGGDGVGG